jgi:hypothetical protein
MKILCNGCSFTYGAGFLDNERESKIWPSLLAKELNADVKNIAFSGSSNLEIFLRTLRELEKEVYDVVVIQWSALRRHWFEPGLDRFYITADQADVDWSNHELYIKASDRKKFNETLSMLTGDYRACLDISTYCKTLIKLSPPEQKIIFVNGLLPWTQELIFPPATPFDMSKIFSQFTKDMLEFDCRDDHEILTYFYNLSSELTTNLKNWVNIDKSWQSQLLDSATLGHHPGPKSHYWLADQVIKLVG